MSTCAYTIPPQERWTQPLGGSILRCGTLRLASEVLSFGRSFLGPARFSCRSSCTCSASTYVQNTRETPFQPTREVSLPACLFALGRTSHPSRFTSTLGLPSFEIGGNRTRILSVVWACRLPSVCKPGVYSSSTTTLLEWKIVSLVRFELTLSGF